MKAVSSTITAQRRGTLTRRIRLLIAATIAYNIVEAAPLPAPAAGAESCDGWRDCGSAV